MNARVEEPKPADVTPASANVVRPAETSAVIPETPAKKKRSGRRLALLVSVPVLLAAGGGYFWLSGGRYVETDNAYVQQIKVALSADVSGRVIGVSVRDNEPVKAGDLLFEIDPEPYRIALDQAEAALASARVNVEQLRVAHDTAAAQLAAARGTLDIRQQEFDRKNELRTQGLTAEASLDDVRLALQNAQTQVSVAEQQLAGSVAALGGDPAIATDEHPAVRTAMAARESAARNLAKTRVLAPADGVVSQVGSLNVGQFVAAGTTIASLVETGETWVEANFKETQLAAILEGMPVEVSIDAFPGARFAGHVQSIGAATGAEFALIPAQNATGNWVKVTQRIPVTIDVEAGDGQTLRAGMSAVVTVDTKPTEG